MKVDKKEYKRKWHLKNKVKNNEISRKWYKEHTTYAAQKYKEYYQKHKDERKLYAKKWQLGHRTNRLLINKNYAKKQLEMWFLALRDVGYTKCSQCGYSQCFAAIDFHHSNPIDKKEESATLIHKKFTKERLDTILRKTIPLCANCHRELHNTMEI